ncbi:MAG: tripartite tricarboxylate transporter substrate binding protein [Burkholderiales bacterium]|nr:tripartite tricarboxylate transporter substrate binding protein [Burkholderiales bacterium]
MTLARSVQATLHRRLLGAVPVVLLAAALAPGARAADWPSKPIRFVLGPAPDVLARLVGQKLFDAWGQQVVVDQRPGAGGIIAGELVAKAPPDGYTWLMSTGAYTTLVGLHSKLPYDFARDLAPVTLMATIPFALVVHPSLPVKTVGDLLGLARARPGQLNYASGGTGTTSHLAGEMFNSMAGVKIVHVPYKSVAAGLVDVMSGQVHTMYSIMQGAVPHMKSGRLRAIGVSSAKRSPAAPELPTIAESGVPGYEFVSWNAVHVPAGTPASVIAGIHAALTRVLALPDVRERMAGLGLEVSGAPAGELGELVRADIAKWGRVIKEAGIRVE